MAVMSLFCRNLSRFKSPAASILGQTPARSVSAFLRINNPLPVLTSACQQCSVSKQNSASVSQRQNLLKSSIQHGQIRQLSQQPQPEQPEESFEEHEKTVYKGILATQIKLVKSFSLMTSLIGLSCQPVLLMKMGENGGNIALMVASGAFLSFFTFATPLLIHWVSKKYVVELMYNKIDDSYTAITYSLLLRKKEVKFKVSDVHVPDIPGMFTTFKANDVPLFVDGQQFDNPIHFGKIMGYDKPINLRWSDGVTQSEAESRKRNS